MKKVILLFLCLIGFSSLHFPAQAQTGRQRELLDSDWHFHLGEVNGASTTPAGMPLTQWVWMADNNAPTDAATMAAPGLDTSSWPAVTVGTDVFGGSVGYAWFRTTITNLASLARPLALYFLSVDDNATVYLNGNLIGQHQGWSQPFTITIDPAWLASGTNVLAVAVQNTGGPGGIYGGVFVQSGPAVQPPGILVTQWRWLADNNAPTDASTMTATNLDTSNWQNAAIGQDVFNGRAGYAWFRTALDALATSGRPLKLHFISVEDNAKIYLNGILLGQHTGGGESFDIAPLDYAWNTNGPNILAIAVQNLGGPGGITGQVSLESGAEVEPAGNPVTQWLWLADNYAPADASTMAAVNLNTSNWSVATVGQNVFSGLLQSAWFRSSVTTSGTTNPPAGLYFVNVSNAISVYLNGTLIGQSAGDAQPLAISPLPGWVAGGTNVLAVAVQGTNGAGGILKPVLLEGGNNGQAPSAPNYDDSSWRAVHLPHDYVIEGTFTNTANAGHGSLPLNTAWYRQTFTLPPSAQGQSVWLDFDGVYHDSDMWLNGHYLGNWYSGYASFHYDISPYMIPGGTNVLAVHLDPTTFEGWWYEGAGIYRHVWLNIANPVHVAPWGTFVTADLSSPQASPLATALLTIKTTVTNAAPTDASCTLVSQITGPDGVMAGSVSADIQLAAGLSTDVVQTVSVTNPKLWSLETPQLYQLHTALEQNNQTVDNVDTPFGIRSIYYDANNGFFLNGKRVEIQGTCNHQDFAGVGIGMPDNLLYWRIKKLKEMGANAYRCSHNPPTAALLDACDRLGMLVMDENRNLGDATGGYSPSTASTPYNDLSALDNMILRDRNHPSIIMWSMCNEEAISGTQAGADIFYAMKQSVLKYDTSRPITCAMNSGWFNVGISLVEDIEGFNYSPGEYDPFHQEFPQQPMYGSETASAVADRGEYTNDNVQYVSEYTTTPENSWQPVVTRPFMAGAFFWTGFDYKGEPSPFGWPCINSKFGAMDICGLPKDMYYYYQSWWGSQPLVHIFPHWNWSAGQTVTVWCYGNTPTVELFLNGVSQGVQTMPEYGHAAWTVPYASGSLLAKGYDSNGNVIATNLVETTGLPASIRLTTDRATLTADNEDLTVVYAAVVDAQGRVVPTASNLVTFASSGAGVVAGVGNGDPACHQPDRGTQRYAFNGWCMALVGATNYSGPVSLTATSPGLISATLSLQALATNAAPAAPTGLSAANDNGQILLTWPISFGATSYNIKRATSSGGPYTTLANYTAVSYPDSAVTSGIKYYYVVSAVNAYGESTNSVEAVAATSSPVPLTPPSGLIAAADDGEVMLSWNTNASATSYQVKRSLSSNGPFTVVASVTLNSFTDTGLSNGTNYFYTVTTVASGLESTDSAPVSIIPVSMSYLVGTITGTTGSWSNIGNTREKAMDGNVNTFFDAPTGTGDWVGLDLGTNRAQVISKIRFTPRTGFSSRMVGGLFQGANQADYSDAVTLFTLNSQPAEGVMTTLLNTNAAAFRYVRYLSPPNGYGNVAEVEYYTPGPHIILASGAILGTAGNTGTEDTNAFDDDITTYFDAPAANGNWAGLDLGIAATITSVRFCPRSGYDAAMQGGIFQGANAADFSDAVALDTLTNTPPDATLTAQPIANTNTFRYVRYLSPNGSYGDVAEVQFFTSTPLASALPAVPTGLTATPGNQQIGLSWNASSDADSYNVKRGTTSGGPYTNIVNRTATIHMDSGLPNGTYYYVVSAVNSAGESANSAEASAMLTCATLPAPTGLALTAQNGALTLSWSSVSGAASYNVLCATSSSGPFTLVATGLTSTTDTDTTITNQNAFYYVVQAVNSCGPSDYSGVVGGSLSGMNVAPTLAAIADQTILAGRTLVITNQASDSEAPPQTLSYTLATAPAGASINTTNGVLTWRPGIAQSGATNRLTVVVANNGLPSLSASQDFNVNVLTPAQPRFTFAGVSNGWFQTSITGDSGPDYSVYDSSNLIDWQLISTTNPLSLPFLFAEPAASNASQRFYQIRLGP